MVGSHLRRQSLPCQRDGYGRAWPRVENGRMAVAPRCAGNRRRFCRGVRLRHVGGSMGAAETIRSATRLQNAEASFHVWRRGDEMKALAGLEEALQAQIEKELVQKSCQDRWISWGNGIEAVACVGVAVRSRLRK